MAITPVGFVGTVQEASFSQMMSAVGGNGIVGSYAGTGFAATRVPGSRSMSIQAGTCWAPGVFVTMDATTTSPAAAANTSGLPRIDLVVMRINWSTHAAALINIAGTPNANPVAPSYNTSPGVLFDIPLRQSLLPSGDADYTAVNIAAGDRRYWLVDGTFAQPSGRVLPDSAAGRLVTIPDAGKILLSQNDTSRWTFNAESDTGWEDLSASVPSGWIGGTSGVPQFKGRIRNGVAYLKFSWQKVAASITDQTFDWSVPSKYIPTTDMPFVAMSTGPEVPVLLTIGTPCHAYSVTNNAGQYIQGSTSYPLG